MTAAVRAILTPFYWLAAVVVWVVFAPLLWPVVAPLPWWAMAAASVAIGLAYARAAWLLLGRLAAMIAGHVEMFAAEWRKLLAAPQLPPTGGDNDGQTRPATGRIHP